PGASADDVLERMQAEIAAIVNNAKGAVVSIEDERASQLSENIDLDKALAEANRTLEKTMQGELQKLDKNDEASAAARSENARRRTEIRQKIHDAQKVAGEAMRKMVPLFAAGAPKTGTGFSIGEGL